MQYEVLITDDEPIARDILCTYVSKLDNLRIAGICKNAVEAADFLKEHHVDILLLDINMPEVSGLDLLRKLPTAPAVILTTAYSEYAVESYELNVVDYLLKPFSFQRFAAAINKVTNIGQQASEPLTNDTIFVKSDGKLVKIDLKELLLIEGVKDYVKLWVGDKPILVHSTMKNIEEQLSAHTDMVRVHKSHIVNMTHVREVEGNILRVGMHEVVIGSTYKDNVSEKLNRYRML